MGRVRNEMTRYINGGRQPGFRFVRRGIPGGSWNNSVVSAVSLAAVAAVFLSTSTHTQTLAFLTTVPRSAAPRLCTSRSAVRFRFSPLRRRRVGVLSTEEVDMTHSCVSAPAATTAVAAAAGEAEVEAEPTTPPTLVSGASDVETFFGRYRVRARRESERAAGGLAEGMVAVPLGEDMDREQEMTAAGGDDLAAVNLGGGFEDASDGKSRASCGASFLCFG